MTRVSPQDELTSEGRTTRVRLLRWAHDLLAILVLLGFVAFLWERRAHLASLLETSVLQLCALAATVVLTWVVVAAQSFLLYRASGVAVGFGECVVLAVGGAFGNYLPMRLGTVVRARYLKVVHGLRYARFGSIFGVRTLLTVAATGALGLIGTVGVALGGGRLSPELLVVFGLLVLVPWLAWRAPLPSRSGDAGRARRTLNDLVDGARTLRQQPATNLLVLALIVLQQVTFALRFGLVLIAADQEPSVPVVLLLAVWAVHRLHRDRNIGVRAHENHRQRDPALAERLLKIQATHARHAHVEDEATGAGGIGCLQERLGPVVGLDRIPFGLQQPPQ